MKAAPSATAPAVPALDLTPTGKVDNFLNAMPTQPGRRLEPNEPGKASSQLTARIEQADLDDGVKLAFKKFGNVVRAAYDPAQFNPLDARLLLNMYVDYTEGDQVDGLRELGRNAEDEASRELYATILGEIDRTGEAPGIVQQVLGLMQQVRAESLPPCPRYSWCNERGEHDEHTGPSFEASCPDGFGDAVLPVGLTDWGKGVRIGLLEHDLTPAEARGKLAELRAHLDAVERLIDTAEAGE